MYKYQFLFFIIFFQLIRTFFINSYIRPKSLILSFFIITIPFDFHYSLISEKLNNTSGTLGNSLNLTIPLILFLLFFPISKYKKISKIKLSIWFKLFIIIIIGSLINPYNNNKFGTIIFLFFLLFNFLFFFFILKTLTQKEIIWGIFDGLSILSILQIFLAICFPLLEIKEVTSIFHPAAELWSTRMNTRVGAVGVFMHPGNLALFTTIVSSFFIGCYFNDFKKKISLIILGLNFVTLLLTYSRTSYLVYIISIFIVYFICKNPKEKFFTYSNIFKIIGPISVVIIYIVFFSPLSEIFLKSDANQMVDARLIQWLMAGQAFITSPIIGVGLNTHLEYMSNHFNLFGKGISDFFFQNPIHNIHLIVIVETGLIGFVFWILFIFINISRSKNDIYNKRNEILSATQIGLFISISLYGITGWAPFSSSILPFILLFSFLGIQFRNS